MNKKKKGKVTHLLDLHLITKGKLIKVGRTIRRKLREWDKMKQLSISQENTLK